MKKKKSCKIFGKFLWRSFGGTFGTIPILRRFSDGMDITYDKTFCELLEKVLKKKSRWILEKGFLRVLDESLGK